MNKINYSDKNLINVNIYRLKKLTRIKIKKVQIYYDQKYI